MQEKRVCRTGVNDNGINDAWKEIQSNTVLRDLMILGDYKYWKFRGGYSDRQALNFLWFVKWEISWKQREVDTRRDAFELITSDKE